MYRRSLRLFLLLLMAFSAMLCGCARDSDVRVLRLAHGLDAQHPVHKAMEYMGELMAEKSDGKLKLLIFPSEQLGSERECIEQVQMGCLDMTKTSASPMESFIPAYAVFSMPYVFRDREHFWNTLDSPVGKKMLALGESVGLRGLCFYDAGSRSFYAQKPIMHPDDLKGMKIRVQKSKTAMDMISALGGSPTPVAWGELYTALQQGVVDGAENNPPSFYTSRHYETSKHYSLDEHTMVPDMLITSQEVWRKLDDETRKILAESAEESSLFQRELWARETEKALAAVAEEGVEIHRPDKAPFQDSVQNMLANCAPEVGELLEEIKEVD